MTDHDDFELPSNVFQDGRDFYLEDGEDFCILIFTASIRVPDWDLEAARLARQEFLASGKVSDD